MGAFIDTIFKGLDLAVFTFMHNLAVLAGESAGAEITSFFTHLMNFISFFAHDGLCMFALGVLLMLYVMFILPSWFRKPNPVIFTPVSFAAIALFLLYVCLANDGNWFLPFAFPVTGFLCLLVTAVVVLCRYTRKGLLYVFGGASLAMGGFMVLLEYLLHITFGLPGIGTWSFYPMFVFALLGITLILIAIVPSFRESLSKKFFV